MLAGGQPDHLIVDMGSNDLGAVDPYVVEIVDNALSFLRMLNAYFPKEDPLSIRDPADVCREAWRGGPGDI